MLLPILRKKYWVDDCFPYYGCNHTLAVDVQDKVIGITDDKLVSATRQDDLWCDKDWNFNAFFVGA